MTTDNEFLKNNDKQIAKLDKKLKAKAKQLLALVQYNLSIIDDLPLSKIEKAIERRINRRLERVCLELIGTV